MKQSDNEKNEVLTSDGLMDKTWVFFEKNKRIIFVFCLVVLAATALFIANKLVVAHQKSQMTKAYSKLSSTTDKAAFVKRYKKFPLAGLVSLSLGDDHLREKDYKAANSEYVRSAKLLKTSLLLPRALISQSVAIYRSGNFADAERMLNSVIYNKTFDKAFRGSAAITLLSMLRNDGNDARADALFQEFSKLDLTNDFSRPSQESR